jgi:hypothetical protein
MRSVFKVAANWIFSWEIAFLNVLVDLVWQISRKAWEIFTLIWNSLKLSIL